MGFFDIEGVKSYALGVFGTKPHIRINLDENRLTVVEGFAKSTTFDLDTVTGFRSEVKGFLKGWLLHVYVEGRADHVVEANSIDGQKLSEVNALVKERRKRREQAPQQRPAPVEPEENAIDKLEKLADLHERGALTDDEFTRMKREILNS